MSNSAGIESYEHKLKSGSHGGKHEDERLPGYCNV
jgi:hypothetical protein